MVDWDAIPAELQGLGQWLPWRFEERDGRRTKVPLCAADPRRRGSSTDPASWGDIQSVRDVVEAGIADGTGFVVTASDDFAGVDIDGCRDPETGQLSPLAEEAASALASYTEITPSGQGIRIWVRAPGVRFARQRYPNLGVELYTEKRFFAVTGVVIRGGGIEERSPELIAWWEELGALDADAKLLKRARSGDGGDKFSALYDRGEWEQFYPSQSEADLGLCAMLARLSGGDRETVDRLFRRSALMREKWERDDYREDTLGKAGTAGGDRDDAGGREARSGPNIATELVALANTTHEFVQSEEGETFAVPLSGPRIAKPLRGGGLSFRQRLRAAYLEATGKAANSAALADAVGVLEGEAEKEPKQRVHVRLAPTGSGGVVLDLGDETGRSVAVGPQGWELTSGRGPLFRRTALTGAMPEPARGGSLEALRTMLNVDDCTWDLLVGYMVAAWIPDIPHPILWLAGEQGTGKTSAMRAIASLLDPSPVATRTPPRDVGEWVVTLSGSWVIPVDNVSKIPEWLSDAMCRAATGDGLARRQLYADSSIVVNKLRNCVMLTGIGIGELRGDLGDRLLAVELERITGAQRQLETQLWSEWEAHLPAMLGALLGLLSQTLAALPGVQLDSHPRMADFAEVLAAVDQVRDTNSLGAYLDSRTVMSEQVIEGDSVAAAIRQLAVERAAQTTAEWEAEWSATAGELLGLLEERTPKEHRGKGWPVNAQQLSVALKRAAPSLAEVGVELTPPTSNRRKLWRVSVRVTPDG